MKLLKLAMMFCVFVIIEHTAFATTTTFTFSPKVKVQDSKIMIKLECKLHDSYDDVIKIGSEMVHVESVSLVGSMFKWKDEVEMTFDTSKKAFTIDVDLEKGSYEYKFLVKGQSKYGRVYAYITDENAQQFVSNHDGLNSVVNVDWTLEDIELTFNPAEFLSDADVISVVGPGFKPKNIYVAGDFNDWNVGLKSSKMTYSKATGLLSVKIMLPPGVYNYQFALIETPENSSNSTIEIQHDEPIIVVGEGDVKETQIITRKKSIKASKFNIIYIYNVFASEVIEDVEYGLKSILIVGDGVPVEADHNQVVE